jgi:hypothetical protein
MRMLAALAAAACALAADAGVVTFSRSFPGSVPPFFLISVEKDGRAVYKEAVDDEIPIEFRLQPAEAAEIFALSEKLGWFTRPVESGLKVAKTGVKTFRYEEGAKKSQVEFNYSLDLNAQKLLDWFERIAETQRRFITLSNATRFDRIGVNDALLLLEAARDDGRTVSLEQFLPLLDRIAKNEAFLHMARARAARLAESIRNPKPEKPETPGSQ